MKYGYLLIVFGTKCLDARVITKDAKIIRYKRHATQKGKASSYPSSNKRRMFKNYIS